MMPFTDLSGLAGLAGHALAGAALAVALSPRRCRLRMRRGIAAVVFIGVLLPLPLPLAFWSRGLFGDLSITSTVLLLLALAVQCAPHPLLRCVMPPATPLLAVIAIVAAVFYPLALGVGMFDPYRLGYAHAPFILLVAAAAALALWRGYPLAAAIIALALLGWSVGFYESTNLWDYLLDLPLAIYAGAALLRRGIIRLRTAR